MTVMVSYLRSRGVDRVLEDSSGNAGASLSTYAAAGGMRCRILVPETASYPKIAQIAAGGADVITIPGSRQDVADEALRQAGEVFYASHNWQPLFVEGIKTLAFELWEQLRFRAPDNIVVPLGYGSNILGCQRGFAELQQAGEIAGSPRLFGVQAANCAPFHAAFRAGVERLVPSPVVSTVAEGIASAKPTRVAEVLRAVRDSGGAVVAVSEAEIVEALRGLAEPRSVRRADRRRRCGGPDAAREGRRDPAGPDDGARADRVGPEGVGDHRRAARAGGADAPGRPCRKPGAGTACWRLTRCLGCWCAWPSRRFHPTTELDGQPTAADSGRRPPDEPPLLPLVALGPSLGGPKLAERVCDGACRRKSLEVGADPRDRLSRDG